MTTLVARRRGFVRAGLFLLFSCTAALRGDGIASFLAEPHTCVWTFAGGSPASSTSCTPPSVSWTTAGTKQVTLKVCLISYPTRCDQITKSLVVSIASPAISGVTSSPSPLYQGDTVTLTAAATGKAPLTYTWVITNGPTLTGNPVSWATAGQALGTRGVQVTVSNAYGSQTYYSSFNITAPAPVIANVVLSPNPVAVGSPVTLTATATGKGTLSYSWTIQGGPTLSGNPASWSTTGQAAGTRTVTLTASSSYGSAVASRALTLQQLLVSSWTASCPTGICIFPAPTTVSFSMSFIQNPTLYEYDWDGNGTYEQSSPLPVVAHTYGVLGIYTPKLRVSKGSIVQVITHALPIAIVGSGSSCTPSSTAGSFYTVTSCRIIDTRLAAGPYGGPRLAVGATRTFPLAGRCGVPSSAKALAVNITAVSPSSTGSLSFGVGVCPNTVTSAVSFRAGQTRANNAVLPLSADSAGAVNVTPNLTAAGGVDLLLDVVGYFQ